VRFRELFGNGFKVLVHQFLTSDIDSYHSCLKKVYPGPYDRYERYGLRSFIGMVLRFLFISF